MQVPLFMGVGEVGSLVDLATFVLCIVGFKRLSDSNDTGHAVAVALAEWSARVRQRLDDDLPRVDPDLVRADLDVPERESAAYFDSVDELVTDGGFPAESEPDGDVSAPHHFYVGVLVSVFGFVSVWDLYPVTGAAMVLVGLAVALDDALSHAFGVPTPLDLLWGRLLFPALQRLEGRR